MPMSKSEAEEILDKLRHRHMTDYRIRKEDFSDFRAVLVQQSDFKHFRGIAQQGGDILYEYLDEPRS